MAYDGNGTYNPPVPQFPAIPGNTIFAEDFNTIIYDLANALSKALLRDGQAPMNADLDLGSKQLKNGSLASAVTATTQPLGTNTNQVATMAALVQQAFSSTLPALPPNGTYVVTVVNGVVSWKPSDINSDLTRLAQVQAAALSFS